MHQFGNNLFRSNIEAHCEDECQFENGLAFRIIVRRTGEPVAEPANSSSNRQPRDALCNRKKGKAENKTGEPVAGEFEPANPAP